MICFNVAFAEDFKELRATLASHVLIIITLLMTQLLCVTSIHNTATMNAGWPDFLTTGQGFHYHSRDRSGEKRRELKEPT